MIQGRGLILLVKYLVCTCCTPPFVPHFCSPAGAATCERDCHVWIPNRKKSFGLDRQKVSQWHSRNIVPTKKLFCSTSGFKKDEKGDRSETNRKLKLFLIQWKRSNEHGRGPIAVRAYSQSLAILLAQRLGHKDLLYQQLKAGLIFR